MFEPSTRVPEPIDPAIGNARTVRESEKLKESVIRIEYARIVFCERAVEYGDSAPLL